MATLYSVEDDGEEGLMLREKMAQAKFEDGSKVYTTGHRCFANDILRFCHAVYEYTAIVKRETRSWKWPVIQLVYMTALAYLMSLLAYQVLS